MNNLHSSDAKTPLYVSADHEYNDVVEEDQNMKALLDAKYRNPTRIAEYRSRYPKCMATLSPEDAATVTRIYDNWLQRQATWHHECFKHVEGAV